MESLEDLVVYTNSIGKLPQSIGKCKNLIRLELNNNAIKFIPKEIGNCVLLEELVCHSNNIFVIPETMKHLVNLKNLDFNKNHIFEIPEELYSLSSLRILMLRNNDITQVSFRISQLTNLKILDLADNKLEFLPEEICDLRLDALWLASNQADSTVLKNLTKVSGLPVDGVVNWNGSGRKLVSSYLLPQEKFVKEKARDSVLGTGEFTKVTSTWKPNSEQPTLARTLLNRRLTRKNVKLKESFRQDPDLLPKKIAKTVTIKRTDVISNSSDSDDENSSIIIDVPMEFQENDDDAFDPTFFKDTRGQRNGTGKRVRPAAKAKMQETGNPEAAMDILLNELENNLGVVDSAKVKAPGINAMFQKPK